MISCGFMCHAIVGAEQEPREAISREITVFVSDTAEEAAPEAISRELTVFASEPMPAEGASEAISREMTVFASEPMLAESASEAISRELTVFASAPAPAEGAAEAISRELTVYANPAIVHMPGHGEAISREATVFAAYTGGQDQTIDFEPIPDMELGAPNYTLVATASSGLPVGFDVVAGPAMVIEPDTLVIQGAGEIAVRAFQEGNTTWNTATPVTNRFAVSGDLQIRSHPQSVELVQGQTAKLNVIAWGTPPLIYQWYRNDQPLPNATNAMLTLDDLEPGDRGSYQVQVTNEEGTLTSNPAVLSILEPPRFLALPTDQTVFVGGSGTFEALVEGTGPFGFQWIYQTNQVVRAFGEGSNLLEVVNVQLEHHRTSFELVVTNKAFPLGIRTPPAFLLVNHPPTFLSEPSERTAEVGDTVELCVQVTSVVPPLFQWRKNGVNLPNETNSCIVLDKLTIADGGSYSVLVDNGYGTIESAPALVIVDLPDLAFADDFNLAVVETAASRSGRGHNLGATAELGEPEHAERPGTNSVWIAWQAPAKGIAYFSTIGSSFDTLLAVYQGSAVSNLEWIASDEDSGGFLTSSLKFNAEEGEIYHIAVAGYFDASGEVVLNWDFEATPIVNPVIAVAPFGQTVAPGGTATLSVEVRDPAAVTYQWYFNGVEIPNATSPTLLVPAMDESKVGSYHVELRNASGGFAESVPVAVHMSEQTGAQMVNKLQDLELAGLSGQGLQRQAGAGANRNFVVGSLARVGYVGNARATTTEPNGLLPCVGGFWPQDQFGRIVVTNRGVLELTTEGSEIDASIVVYRGDVKALVLEPHPLLCGDGAFENKPYSKVLLPVEAGDDYVIRVFSRGSGNYTINMEFVSYRPIVTILPGPKIHFRNLQPYGKYKVEWTTDFRRWNTGLSPQVYSGELECTFQLPPNKSDRFYRIVQVE